MQQLFKRYFWAIRLVGIMALAAVIAGGINDWVGSRFFAIPALPEVDPEAVEADERRRAWGRVAADEDAAQTLSARHVFDLDPEPDTPPEPAEPVVAEPEEPEDNDDGELDDTELAIDLVGTLVMEEPASSVATPEIEGDNRIGWTGSELLDGKAKIVKIAQRHIVLEEEGGELTVVRLWDDGTDKKGVARPGRPGRNVRGRTRPRTNPRTPTTKTAVNERVARAQRLRRGVKRAGAYKYNIDRSMLNEELQDLSRLQREARVVPSYKDRAYNGVKLVGVRPGSLYRALGIRSGDVLTAVNGQKIDSPTKGLDLFDQLKNASSVQVQIERRGRKKTLDYTIK